MKRIACAVVLLLVCAPVMSRAESFYVTDRFQVNLLAAPEQDAAVVKKVTSGILLEVLERVEPYAHVRDAQGAEGWIEIRYLTPEPPAQTKLAQVNDELARSRAQLSGMQARLARTKASLVKQTSRALELEKRLAELDALENIRQNADPSRSGSAAPATEGSGGVFFSVLWVLISFAMLIIGFAGGIAWLREVNRRKLGGMHLRI